ncbi:MAG: carboxypeptidase-like regulatory domain-containing protein [Bacteroidota bacterium]|nr:carboxypeptidase-like regulatory domain-containing protein [Bacteroidota bacterium]
MSFKKLVCLVASIFVVLHASTQEKKTGVISGVVKDARTKSPLNEAVVTLSSNAFKGQKFALTDSTGMYKVSNLPAGYYMVSFEMEGYQKFVQDSIQLHEGMSLGVSFQMVKEPKAGRNKNSTGYPATSNDNP